jgi:hypothetical protein
MRTDNVKANQIRTNNDLQNTTQNTKDRAKRALLEIEGKLICPGRVNSSCPTSDTRRITLVTNAVIIHE